MKDNKRLTEKRETPLVMSMWADSSYSLKIHNRLADLEDKIERGEIDYVADKDKAVARLTAENERLREEVDSLSHENDELEYKIERFEAKIAALQKRLENAVELPRLEISPYDDNDTFLYYLENGHIQQECFNNKHPEQLQKRLAELKGG